MTTQFYFTSLADAVNRALQLSKENPTTEIIVAQYYRSGEYYATSSEREIGSNDSIIEVYLNGESLNVNA